MSTSEILLEVKHLKMHFPLHGRLLCASGGLLKAVDDVSFAIDEGETLGLVGESGCGKSTLARAIVRLYKPTSGEILLRHQDLAQLEGSALRQARRNIQMIFQDPYASLNPRMTVEAIVSEPLRNFGLREGSSEGTADRMKARVAQLLNTVGLDSSMLHRYPHEFSGGQRQRIGIARALALHPALVVADEPASALDVSVQAQIVNLLRELQARLRLSYLFISHDLSVVSLISHRVAVMYLGELVEIGPTQNVFADPWHPYTEALISAVPIPDPRVERSRPRVVLRGDIPSPLNKPSGCPFHVRCPYAFARCIGEKPVLREYGAGRQAACHLLEDTNQNPRIHRT